MDREQTGGPTTTGASQMETAGRAPGLAGVPQWWLMNLLVGIESTMPMSEVVHSLYTQAVHTAAMRDLPSMRAFADVALRHLQSKVAVAGYIRRIAAGDTAAATIAGLREQMEIYQRTHMEMGTNLRQVLGEAAARENPLVQSMNQVMGLMDQAHRAIQTMMQPMMTAPAAGTDP